MQFCTEKPLHHVFAVLGFTILTYLKRLNDSLNCLRYAEKMIGDFQYFLFSNPALFNKRIFVLRELSRLDVPLYSVDPNLVAAIPQVIMCLINYDLSVEFLI